MRWKMAFLAWPLGLVLAFGGLSQASQLAIPRVFQGTPASNLSLQGTVLSPAEAMQRRLQGEDLSLLEPYFIPGADTVWSDQKLPASNAQGLGYPTGAPSVEFVAFSAGDGPGLFRAQVVHGDKAFRLAVSLTSHGALSQAALLRKLGYKIDSPQWYPRLDITFENAATREEFLARVGAATLIDPNPSERDKKRWVLDVPAPEASGRARLVLQDVILETINNKAPPLHWSMLTAKAISGRREFRALATPFALLAIPESLNYYDWRAGRIESENWIVKFPVAEQFQEVTIDDIRWSARRILKLSDSDWREILAEGRFPKSYERLLFEVTKARRNDLATKLKLTSDGSWPQEIPFQFGLTLQDQPDRNGEVIHGKAERERVEGYAERFSYGDPDPILPTSEKLRFLLSEGIAYGMGQAFSKLNDATQILKAETVFKQHQADLTKKINSLIAENQVRMAKGQAPKSLEFPANTFIGPTAGFDLDASRSVNVGTYYGSSPQYPVQMVDRLTVGAHAGVVAGMSLNEFTNPAPPVPLQPIIEAQVKTQRTYIRVRPITKIKDALEHNWGELFVPGFLGGLARVLETGVARTSKDAPAAPNTGDTASADKSKAVASSQTGTLKSLAQKAGLAEVTFPVVQWPVEMGDGQTPHDILAEVAAVKADEGADKADATHTSEASEADSESKKLKAFLDELRPGEIFHIVDTVSTGVGVGVTIPIGVLIGAVPFGEPISVGLGLSGNVVVMRRTTIERKEDGLHVYLQRANMKSVTGTMSLSAIVKLVGLTRMSKSGTANDRAYLLNTYETTQAGESDEQKKQKTENIRKLNLSLVQLLRQNAASALEENFEPYTLSHAWTSRLARDQFLMFQKSIYQEDHWLDVTPPRDRARPDYDPATEKRSFFTSRVTRRKGINWFSFLKDSVPSLLKDAKLSPVSNGGSADPATDFMGSGQSSTVRTEGEVTSGRPDAEVILPVTMVEQHSAGWQMSRSEAVQVLAKMERQFTGSKIVKTRLFRDEHLGTMNDVQLYDLSATLIIYGEGMRRLMNLVAYPDGDVQAGARRSFDISNWNDLDGVEPILGGSANVCRFQGSAPQGRVMLYGPEWAFRNLQWLWGADAWERWAQTDGREWTTSSAPGMMNRNRYSEVKSNPWYFQRGCLRKVVAKLCSEGNETAANALQARIEGVDAGAYQSVSERYASYCQSSGFSHENYVVDSAPDWMRKILALRRPLHVPPGPEAGALEIKRVNERVDLLLSQIEWPRLMQIVGEENLFFQMRLTGFRENLENGDTKDAEFLSDSIGLYDPKAAAGPTRALMQDTGLSGWEVSGSYYSDGE